MCLSDHLEKRALTQFRFDSIKLTADALVFRFAPVVKRESFMTYRTEVVIAPRVDYSGCTNLLIVVVPGLLPKDHEVFVLEKLGLRILLVGRLIRTIRSNVSGFLADIACASFRFIVASSRRSCFRIAHLFEGSLSQIRMSSILSIFGVSQGLAFPCIQFQALVVADATIFVSVV